MKINQWFEGLSRKFKEVRDSEELTWKDELHQLNIEPFQSPTGPTVTIPDNVFQLYFDICLQETIIGESNKPTFDNYL